MTQLAALQPWDEAPMRHRLMRVLRKLQRVRLDLLTPAAIPSMPGVYTQWFATRTVEPVLGCLVAEGRVAAYQGVAAVSLRERIGRYRQSLAGTAIGEHEVFVAVLPCASRASALFAEAALIDELQPPLLRLGWGAKAPGGNRREQSPVDALFPGRRWAAPVSLVAQADARLQVLSRLAVLDPAGPRWPRLPDAVSPAEDPHDHTESATVTPIDRSR